MFEYVLFASGGNDSIALCQYAVNQKWKNVIVAYSNTGWASPEWPARIERFASWVKGVGFEFEEIPSEGMDALVTRKKGFPANKPKFCTYELKIGPAKAWLDTIDQRREAVCCVGIRRSESASRANWPEWEESSENHGGRPLHAPLVRHTDAERDALVQQSGWEVLPHRSRECSPCVNSKKSDLLILPEADIEKVRKKEQEMRRTFFRAHRMMGAKGIDQAMDWARSKHGQYEPPDDCGSGMCGD